MTYGASKIVISRPMGGRRDRLRAYKVVIDGVERGEIRRGQRLTYGVPPGMHQVRARIDWTGSPDLTLILTDGDEAQITVEPAGGSWSTLFHFFGSTSWLRLTFMGMHRSGTNS